MPRHEQQPQQYETSVDGAGVAAGSAFALAERNREAQGRWHDLYADCPVPSAVMSAESLKIGERAASWLPLAQLATSYKEG